MQSWLICKFKKSKQGRLKLNVQTAFFNTEAKCNNISFKLKQGEVSVF